MARQFTILTVWVLLVPRASPAMGFSCRCSPSLREEAASCYFVVVGMVQLARGGADKDAAELVVGEVLKGSWLGFGKGTILKVPANASAFDLNNPRQYVVFGGLEAGGPQAYRGEEVNPAQLVYL